MRASSSSLRIIWCNKLSYQHRPEDDGSYSVPIIADSFYVSGGLCETKLRSSKVCFRPSDIRLHGRTWQCISFKYVLISPTSFVDAAYQIQLERSFWDIPGTALHDRKQWMFGRIILQLVHVFTSVFALKSSRLLEEILPFFFSFIMWTIVIDKWVSSHVTF